MTKLKVDLRNGFLEVEGEEEFVREIYGDYKDALAALTARLQEARLEGDAPPEDKDEVNTSGKMQSTKPRGTNKARVGGVRKETYEIVKDLQLTPKDGGQSLRAFFKEKSPQTAMENNTVFIYYLEKIVKISGISANHIYTCYKDVSIKVPGALLQSLKDTAHRKGWIDTKSMDSINLTTIGENLVEHDLPKKKEAAQ